MNRLAIVLFAEYHCPLSEEQCLFTEIALYGAIVLAVFQLSTLLYIQKNGYIQLKKQSGIRESNPPPKLGKLMHYRCANAAVIFKSGAKVRLFFDICK